MFYDLLDLQLNNNNYRLLQVNKSVKNKFLTNFLIGLDSKYLKLDEPDMNKTSNYYKDKLNDKIMLQYNKNFSKANTSHLDYLSDICRVNLVIYDMTKNKQKYTNNNGSSKTLYMLKNGTTEFLLLKENKNFMRALLPMSLADKLSGLSLEGGFVPLPPSNVEQSVKPSVSNTSNNNSIINDNESVQQQKSINYNNFIALIDDYTYESISKNKINNFVEIVDEEIKRIKDIEELMKKLNLGEDIINNIRKYISVINTEILLTSKQFTTYELLKSQIDKKKVENKDDSEMSNNQNGGDSKNIPKLVIDREDNTNQSGGSLERYKNIIERYNNQRAILRLPYQYNIDSMEVNETPNTYINRTLIVPTPALPQESLQEPVDIIVDEDNILSNLNAFISSNLSKSNNTTDIPEYIRYMYENYLDTIKDFASNNEIVQEIFKIFTETNRQRAECPDDSLDNGVFTNNSIIKYKYIYVFMEILLDKPDIKLLSNEQKKLFTTLKLFKPNCVGFCGNFSNNWFTNQFINWNANWNYPRTVDFINQRNHFRNIIIIENSEGYDVTTLMLKYLKEQYSSLNISEYGINLIRFINPTTLIDSESTKSIKPDNIVIPPPPAQPNTEKGIISSLNFYNINVNSIVGDNFNEKLNIFWNTEERNMDFFKVTDTLYLRNVYDYNIVNNQCNLSDIYSSYFDFINTFYMNYRFKFHFRLAKLTNDTGRDDNDTEYRILLTTQIKQTVPDNTHRISFILDGFGKKSSINEYIANNLQDNNNNLPIPLEYQQDEENEVISVTTYNGVNIENNRRNFNYFSNVLTEDLDLFIPYHNMGDNLLKKIYGIILTRIFGQINNDNRNYMKRLLYTFKLIGDQGQIRFAKLLKEHIQNNTDYRNKYSVLYTSNDFASHIYAGLLGQESYHINGHYFGDEVGSKFKFVDKMDTYRTKMLLYLSP